MAIGSALMMVVSKYGFPDIQNSDGARVAAQVVSGVGFLGAGVIFVRNNLVNGLTTAAGICYRRGRAGSWGGPVHCGHIVCGSHHCHADSDSPDQLFCQVPSCGCLRMTIAQKSGAVKNMEEFLEKEKVEIASVKINKNKKDEIKLEFEVIYPPGFNKGVLLSKLAEENTVMAVSE